MTIPEDMIMRHLDMLLTSSNPGDTMHHLHVVSAPDGAVGPLGVPDEAQLHVTVYALAPTPPVNVPAFTAEVIMAVAAETRAANTTPLFAGLSQEAWTVRLNDDGPRRFLADRLLREGRLAEHPDAVEMTVVYAASRDGRRWRGRRWLTGPDAGTTEETELLVGRPHPDENRGMGCARLIRRLVGGPE